MKNGKLILFPIKSRYQLRPRLKHMDKADEQLKATIDRAGEPGKTITVRAGDLRFNGNAEVIYTDG